MWLKPYPQPTKPEKRKQEIQSLKHITTLCRNTGASLSIIARYQEMKSPPIKFNFLDIRGVAYRFFFNVQVWFLPCAHLKRRRHPHTHKFLREFWSTYSCGSLALVLLWFLGPCIIEAARRGG
jgi:hypothetical protein